MNTMTRPGTDDVEQQDLRAAEAFTQAFNELRIAGIIVPLRPKALSGPSMFEGDFDVLYDPQRFAAVVRRALAAARQHGVSMLVDQTAPAKKRLTFLSGASTRGILLELWPHAEVLSADGAARAVEWRTVAPRLKRLPDGYAALPPDIEAAFYLAHLHHKRKSLGSAEVRARLAHYRALLAEWMGETTGALVAAIDDLTAERTTFADANRTAWHALLQLGLAPQRSLRRRGAMLWRRGVLALRRRMPEPPVPVVGPDGVGKTSITDLLTEQAGLTTFPFKNAFRYSRLYRTVYARSGEPGGLERNLLDEKFVQLLLTISRLRWPIVAHRRRQRAGAQRPVLVDRYFWDYFLRLRDASKPPAKIAGYALHSRLAPTPHSAVVLVCRLETMLARKQELTPAAVEALYDVYCEQLALADAGRALIQSTDMPLEASVRSVTTFLADRAKLW